MIEPKRHKRRRRSMTVGELLDAQPAHLPPGYRFLRKLRGPLFEGFRGDDEQVILVYGRGWNDSGAYRPLLVYVSPSTNGDELFSTEEKAGRPIDLGIDGTRTVYHDGRWELGPGFDARVAGDVTVHWDSSDWHSLTVVHSAGVYAVRGARQNSVGVRELVDVAKSLPY
jgi:hypothetical protein